MTTTVNAIISKSFKAVLNGNKIDVNRCRFICNQNDLDILRFDDYSVKIRKRAESSYNRALMNYQKIKSKPQYVLLYPYDGNELHGSVVHEVIEQDSNGVFNDYEADKLFKPIGTIIQEGRDKKIETDEVVVEKIRRSQEYQKIKDGKLVIFYSSNEEDNRNPDKYIQHLEARDEEFGKFVTRGHGLRG